MHHINNRATPHPPLFVALSQVHRWPPLLIGAPRRRPNSTASSFFSARRRHASTVSPQPLLLAHAGNLRPTGPLPSATPLQSPRRANTGRTTLLAPGALTARGHACAAPLARLPWAGITARPGQATHRSSGPKPSQRYSNVFSIFHFCLKF
jgi:hypothetical protein